MAQEKQELIVLLDCENFQAVREQGVKFSDLLDSIMGLLSQFFRISHAIAYTHLNCTAHSSELFSSFPFETKSIDALIPQSHLKNTIDIVLAMDSVRLAMQHPNANFALLVAGDKDYASTAAYLRRCLHKKIIAFSSPNAPNPHLAQEVNLSLQLNAPHLWSRQIYQYLHKKSTVAQRSFLERLLMLIESLDYPAACPLAIVERETATKNCVEKLQALGCTLSDNKKWVLRWGNKVQASIDQTKDPFENLHFSPNFSPETEGVLEVFLRAFKLLTPLRFPMPVSALQAAIRQSSGDLPKVFSRNKLSNILKSLDFTLNETNELILYPTQHNAIAICQQAHLPLQSSLF